MDIVAAEMSVGDEPFTRRIVVLRGEVDRGGDTVGKITGGTELCSDDVFVRFGEPFLQGETQVGAGLPGVTIKNDFEKIGPLEHWNEKFKKKRRRVRDRFSAMGE